MYITGGGDVANPAEKRGRGCIVGSGENQKCSSDIGSGRGGGALGVCMSAFLGTTNTLPGQLPQLIFLPSGVSVARFLRYLYSL